MEQQRSEFYKELNTDNFLRDISITELRGIINYQNKRLTDLNHKLGVTENLLERIFRLNILKQSKLKLDMCTYMSAKKGVSNGKKESETSRKINEKNINEVH